MSNLLMPPWLRRTVLLLLLVLTAGLAGVSEWPQRLRAQATVQWQADYWANTTLAGPPAATRTESTPDYNWGDGAPADTGLPSDRFSARWRTTLDLPAGRYEFVVQADDGVRLWVDDEQLINEWTVQSREQFVAQKTLDGAPVNVRLDYFENTGEALISLSWRQLDAPGPDVLPTTTSAAGAPVNLWRGEYFADTDLTQFAFVRNDADLNFNWGAGSPNSSALGNDRFSARWTRTLPLDSGTYRFTVTADDGVRMWIDGQLVIDQWTIQAARTFEAVIPVRGGPTPVRVEYFENSGQALIEVTWQRVASTITTPTPTPFAVPPGDLPIATMTGARYLNVRSGPSIAYGRVTVIPYGTTVNYLERAPVGVWVRVQVADGVTGWVNSRYFTSNTPIIDLPVAQQ
jgi:hypothetical protein